MSKRKQKPSKPVKSSTTKHHGAKAKKPRRYESLSEKRRRGPVNPAHKTYMQSEKSIQHALHSALSHRCINAQATRIFRKAEVAPPTFYLHCCDANDALRRYEHGIEKEFKAALPKNSNREMLFTIFLAFIYHHHGYFSATCKNRDFYLISRLLMDARPLLVGAGDISEKSYAVFIAHINAIIFCWIEYDHCQKDLLPTYAKKLARLRFIDFNS